MIPGSRRPRHFAGGSNGALIFECARVTASAVTSVRSWTRAVTQVAGSDPRHVLPLAKLTEYVGPTAARTALALAPGAVSDPVRSSSGFHVLLLVHRDEETVPPLADIEDEVREEWRRRNGEHALRTQLDDLRARASVEVTAEP